MDVIREPTVPSTGFGLPDFWECHPHDVFQHVPTTLPKFNMEPKDDGF